MCICAGVKWVSPNVTSEGSSTPSLIFGQEVQKVAIWFPHLYRKKLKSRDERKAKEKVEGK